MINSSYIKRKQTKPHQYQNSHLLLYSHCLVSSCLLPDSCLVAYNEFLINPIKSNLNVLNELNVFHMNKKISPFRDQQKKNKCDNIFFSYNKNCTCKDIHSHCVSSIQWKNLFLVTLPMQDDTLQLHVELSYWGMWD